MSKRIIAVFCLALAITNGNGQGKQNDRRIWLNYLDKLARPVMMNLANGDLKTKMPVELSPSIDNAANRKTVAYLEALGRTFSGIAPWLNLEGGSREEASLRDEYRAWSVRGITQATDPSSKDYMRWNGGQPLVDAAFLAFGLVRCPWVWEHLDTSAKQNVVKAFKTTRSQVPGFSNWVLFTGMIEAFFCKYGFEYDAVRVDYAVGQFANHWYVGDGMFSDGTHFNMDYYNSIVIHPFLACIVDVVNARNKTYNWFSPNLLRINERYAQIQERNINTDGSYPVIGRSIVYRGGVFHHLADMALRKKIPASLKPAQVRSALTAVIHKTLDAPGTYTNTGFLSIGLYGSQPDIADGYITTGSLYLCLNIFLPLGLAETDEFWSQPSMPWTAVKALSGQRTEADHAADIKL